MSDTPTRWDLKNVFPSLGGPEYQQAFGELERAVQEFDAWCDERSIRRLPEPPIVESARLALTMTGLLHRANDIQRRYETMDSYIYSFLSTDSRDAHAVRETSRLEQVDTRRQKIWVRLQAWIGSLGPLLPDLIPQADLLKQHAYFLEETARQSRFLMSDEMEALAAELNVDGANAFGKLQGNVTSQLKVPFERGGKVELLPSPAVVNLRSDPDPGVRERAHRAEIAGWESIRTSVAASLNSVKGAALTLAKRRGRASVLEQSLDQNRMDQATLDALLGAIREAFPMFRRYLGKKAQRLGKPRLAWWDLFAPVGATARTFTWREARDFIVDKFGLFSEDLAEMAARAFDRRWIDGEMRDGKRGGAFCMGVIGVEESRILANFDGSFDQVSTLAHELGHAYHNHCQSGLQPLQRGSPMTLAETASIFCETLVTEAALAEATPAQQLGILELQLLGACQVCLDISSRYRFERAVFERRAERELDADEICGLMAEAQKDSYGDAVDPTTYNRYMWLWKPHYYSPGYHFYNFPYAFGHLFSLGLYAQFRREGKPFVPRYRELLRSTGMENAAPLAARFGIDIRKPDFWRSSLQVIGEQVDRYERL